MHIQCVIREREKDTNMFTNGGPFNEGEPTTPSPEQLLQAYKDVAACRKIPGKEVTFRDLGFAFEAYTVISDGNVPTTVIDTNENRVRLNLPAEEAAKLARLLGVTEFKTIQLSLHKK